MVKFFCPKKERKKTDNPREGREDGTPPPHRDFKVFCPVSCQEAQKNSFVRVGRIPAFCLSAERAG